METTLLIQTSSTHPSQEIPSSNDTDGRIRRSYGENTDGRIDRPRQMIQILYHWHQYQSHRVGQANKE